MGYKQSQGVYALIYIFKITSTILYKRGTCDYVKRLEFKAETTVYYLYKYINIQYTLKEQVRQRNFKRHANIHA